MNIPESIQGAFFILLSGLLFVVLPYTMAKQFTKMSLKGGEKIINARKKVGIYVSAIISVAIISLALPILAEDEEKSSSNSIEALLSKSFPFFIILIFGALYGVYSALKEHKK